MKNNLTFLFLASLLTISCAYQSTAYSKSKVEPREQFMGICMSFHKFGPKDKLQFCQCLQKAYEKKGFTNKEDLKLIKDLYTGKTPDKPTDVEEALFNFDADVSEACLKKLESKK